MNAVIAVVDDDESVRESLPDLLREIGYEARPFASAEAFLASGCVSAVHCLILDVAMPGLSGPGLQRELYLRGYRIPTIFITALADKSIPPGCLFKPFSEQALRAALAAALART